MSVQQLLQQLLQSGQNLARDAGSKMDASSLSGSKLGGFGGGALAGGALALLLGNKKFRKMGGKLATYGGTAALGALALKAFQDWQSRSASTQAAAQPALSTSAATSVPIPGARLEQDSKMLLAAMIAAAKADGHIGADEKLAIDTEVAKLTNNPSDLEWFEAELAKPADPAQAAALASTPEQAAEVYLASLIVVDEESFMERAYLDELARQLNLDPGLKTALETQVKSLS